MFTNCLDNCFYQEQSHVILYVESKVPTAAACPASLGINPFKCTLVA